MHKFITPLFLLLAASTVQAIEYPSKSTVLKNGLKVIVCEKPDNDFAELEVWYRTGSKDEVAGIRGMAHLFEHMMFRGTEKYPGKSVFENVDKVGGQVNAYTTYDRTVYHEYIPVTALEKMMDIEADRMAHLEVTQEILNTEREVVGEELRNGMNNWYQKMNADRYPYLYPKGHPYEVDVIGFLDEITKFTAEQCMEFFRNYYSPNNAFVVVVGNVKADEVFAMAEKYFGAVEKQLNKVDRRQVPVIDTAKVRASEMSLSFPVQIYSYIFPRPRPAIVNNDFYAMQVLTDILFLGNNSILNNRLVKKDHLAYGMNPIFEQWSAFSNFAVIDVIMNASPGNVRVKRAIREEINKIIEEGIPQQTLDDYMTAYENSDKLANYECANVASELGIAEYYLSDYKKAYTLSQEYKKVSPADIKRVAAAYLAEDKVQVINIKPE